ncbi:MAG: hypothetical protein KKB50_10335 [Planctomycetes bacterium]|nr:hypothetical protein [Planctomycetota bacterium]
MKNRYLLLVMVGSFVTTSTGLGSDDQRLLARTASDLPTATPQSKPPADTQAAELEQLEEDARIDLVLSQARLDLIQGRKALLARRYTEAATKAQSALTAFGRLPADIDVSVFELQAEGILARVRREAGEQALLGQNDPPDEQTRRAMQSAAPPDQLDARTRAAAQIARHYEGADTADMDTGGDVAALRERTLQNQWPDRFGYRPAREIIDVDAILERDQQRLFYEDVLRTAYQADEARRLTQADEARIAPDDVIAYPDDWPEKMAKREKYKDGVIARSPSWFDKDGREWYVAIYDVHDLIYQVPQFQNIEGLGMTPRRSTRVALDRQALRMYSDIFNRSAADLAAGIPLLRYFGGVDDFGFVGPKYSAARQQEIVEMIKSFTGNWESGARIETVGP